MNKQNSHSQDRVWRDKRGAFDLCPTFRGLSRKQGKINCDWDQIFSVNGSADVYYCTKDSSTYHKINGKINKQKVTGQIYKLKINEKIKKVI